MSPSVGAVLGDTVGEVENVGAKDGKVVGREENVGK